MLSGRRAFRGDTPMDTMTAILKEDPPDLPLPSRAHSAGARAHRRSLPREEPGGAVPVGRDLAFALEALSTTSQSAAAMAGSLPARIVRERVAWSLVALLAIAVVTLGLRELSRPSPESTAAFNSTILLPDGWILGGIGAGNTPPTRFAVSPDGRRLAFVARTDKTQRLWVRPLDASSARSLDGTDGATMPFWSADSRFVGFFAGGKLKRIDPAGGPAIAICDAPAPGPPTGATWNGNGTILFSVVGKGLFRVSANGGTPSPVTDAAGRLHHLPSFLPDGEHFLFRVAVPGSGTSGLNTNEIRLGSLASPESRLLFSDSSQAYYAQGHILFVRNGTLMAQVFDARTFATAGDPFIAGEDVLTGGGGASAFAASPNGVLVFQGSAVLGHSRLAWVDRSGKEIEAFGDEEERWSDVQISNDGKRFAVAAGGTSQGDRTDVWIFERGLRTRFTTDDAADSAPVWAPDDQQIVFTSARRGSYLDLFIKASTNVSAEEVLLADSSNKYPLSFSPRGDFLLYRVALAEAQGLWILPLTGDRKPFPLVATGAAGALAGQFSPNGRWIAYPSNQTGVNEVYVSPFPGPGKAIRVSTRGGQNLKWRADGKELLYVTPTDVLMSVDVDPSGAEFVVGSERPLFEAPFARNGTSWYDVAPDGQRFLVNLRGDRRTRPTVDAGRQLAGKCPAIMSSPCR